MRLSLILIALAVLTGCSGTPLKGLGGGLVDSAVRFFGGADDDALQPLSGGNHCDALCEQNRQLRSNQLADEYYRLQAQARKEQTEEAFEAYMDQRRAGNVPSADDIPVVIVDTAH